ncbi:Hypothetical protein CAP_0443 [Chondromyces apiculatus DSM 436]|uniref:Uncharacterized protein n=1 Tax=Chondromyces apiculatus DSM 436 TaxID=1192034 RepID=A0A017SV11_9BACT|nr:Hypothetical protein CAP_0443 [Chondromyces apiculatus DSM 436]
MARLWGWFSWASSPACDRHFGAVAASATVQAWRRTCPLRNDSPRS